MGKGLITGLLIGLMFVCFPVRVTGVDFFIPENPSLLRLLDGYQQTLSSEARASIQPFTPFRIIERSMMLGDGLTLAMKCEFNGKLYFVLLDDQGQFPGSDQQILRNCRMASDTLTVSSDKSVSFILPGEKSNIRRVEERMLAEGQRIIRFFSHNESDYVALAGGTGEYGWCKAKRANAWSREKSSISIKTAQMPLNIYDQIQLLFGNFNQSAQRLFAYYSQRSGKDMAPPRWVITELNGQVKAELMDRRQIYTLEKSMMVLLKELDSILAESGYRYQHRSGVISIAPEN